MSDWVASPISLNYIPALTSWVEMCHEARKWGLGVWLCFLRSDFSNLKLCNLTRRFYAGKQLKSGSWPSRPWIFHLAGVCLLSTFHFCLLKIWLTEPASRETPFSSDKGPLRGKGSLRGSGSATLSGVARRGAEHPPAQKKATVWFLSLGTKRWLENINNAGFSETTPHLGPCWVALKELCLIFRGKNSNISFSLAKLALKKCENSWIRVCKG